MHDVLRQACQLCQDGKRAKALDTIFDHLDDHLLDGDFGYVDAIIAPLDPTELPLTLRLGVLSITLYAKAHLPSRPAFFARVAESIKDEPPDRIQGLIGGLE